MAARSTRTLLPLIMVSAGLVVLGLALGAGLDSEDASLANSASKVLLTFGLLALVASCIAEALRRRRDRTSQTDVHQIP